MVFFAKGIQRFFLGRRTPGGAHLVQDWRAGGLFCIPPFPGKFGHIAEEMSFHRYAYILLGRWLKYFSQ